MAEWAVREDSFCRPCHKTVSGCWKTCGPPMLLKPQSLTKVISEERHLANALPRSAWSCERAVAFAHRKTHTFLTLLEARWCALASQWLHRGGCKEADVSLGCLVEDRAEQYLARKVKDSSLRKVHLAAMLGPNGSASFMLCSRWSFFFAAFASSSAPSPRCFAACALTRSSVLGSLHFSNLASSAARSSFVSTLLAEKLDSISAQDRSVAKTFARIGEDVEIFVDKYQAASGGSASCSEANTICEGVKRKYASVNSAGESKYSRAAEYASCTLSRMFDPARHFVLACCAGGCKASNSVLSRASGCPSTRLSSSIITPLSPRLGCRTSRVKRRACMTLYSAARISCGFAEMRWAYLETGTPFDSALFAR
jgi:hypothetical protein